MDDVGEIVRSAVVETTNGPVRGYRDGGLTIFKGLRYAAPPLRNLRFRPPEPLARWREPAEALSLGAPAIQASVPPGEKTGGRGAGDPPAPGQPGTAEDCLFLNLWTPALSGARPVMVWLHGGGFANGSGGAAMYDGAALARRGEVVTVTLNHRLNAFGYLHLAAFGGHPSSGVVGMLDILAALGWVRDNIASFGGDPANVTVFGESGGGWKVSLLMAMPGAEGLFHKAIVQSGPGLRATPTARADELAGAVLGKLGAASAEDLVDIAAAHIQGAAAAAVGPDLIRGFAPCIDGLELPRHPFEPDAAPLGAPIPLLIGANKDEATLFMFGAPNFGQMTEADVARRAEAAAPGKADALIAAVKARFPDYSPTHLVAAIQTLTGMWLNSVQLAERKAAQKAAAVYMYRLDWETPVARGALRCPHALEIPLVFDNVEAARNFVGRGEAPAQVAELMAPAWLAFARTGNPSTAALPAWPAYEANARATMVFDLQPRVENDPFSEIRALLA
jgi:para-nitrobenzyl esterase